MVALTPDVKVYHRLNLVWGVIPLLLQEQVETFEALVKQAETLLVKRNLAQSGDKVLIMAGIPTQKPKGTNFLKIHTID